METVKVDNTQPHRVTLASADRIGITAATVGIIITVVGVVWGFSLMTTRDIADIKGDVKVVREAVGAVNVKVDAVKAEVAEVRTDVRELRAAGNKP